MGYSGDKDSLTTMHRRKARGKDLDYGDTVVIHESSKRRVTVVPFFIPRWSGTDLSIKLQSYEKRNEWYLLEDKSLSLNEKAARKLLKALEQNLEVAKDNEGGDYLLIRLDGSSSPISGHDPATVASALTQALSQEEIVAHLSQAVLSDELTSALRTAVRLSEMRAAVAHLRHLLDSGQSLEKVYQNWCEKHTWAFGSAYVARDEIRQISVGDTLDMLLPQVISGYRDVIELKRPDMKVLIADPNHSCYYFSADVSQAIGQCHRYLDVLHRVAEKGLEDSPEIVAYHPRAIIVIGRSKDWDLSQLKSLHGLNSRLAGITVMTYDQLLAQGERLISVITNQDGSSASESSEAGLSEFFDRDDDIPF